MRRPIHPDFQRLLDLKEQGLVDLFVDLRNFIIELHPEGNEVLYHTHALSAVFSTSAKISDAYCLIPIYTNHLNLGFSRGTLLKDPTNLLTGTGKWMRHLRVNQASDYRNGPVKALLKAAVALALEDMNQPVTLQGSTISKIKS